MERPAPHGVAGAVDGVGQVRVLAAAAVSRALPRPCQATATVRRDRRPPS